MACTDFRYTCPFVATDDMKQGFDEAGFVIIRGLLDKDEVVKLTKAAETNTAFSQHAFNLDDNEGRKSRMVAWDHPGDDVTGILSRSARIVRTCEKLLGDEVYHYHGKLMMKNPQSGGKFVWHQDYGYWYQNGNLFPDMMSVFVAIDQCTKENGCLQVLKGSHKCGRIDHCAVGGQTGADVERVSQLKTVCPLVFVELEPGDALFFHANLLHTSNANTSDRRRWAFIIAINTKHNDPVKKHHHPQYTKLNVVDDSALKACENYYDMTGKDFMNAAISKTIKAEP
ncbi:L-proline trans-4-hydroxylase-like [Haliotis cracherodii]|uniref:L-proline trans-4-hydroxylase-like n=1 Tax=Haliotis cracherodii TaxID=6455 RepID=UPI0039EBE24B